MWKDVDSWIKTCPRCQSLREELQPTAGLLLQIRMTRPWEKVGLDLIGPLPKTARGNSYAVVMQDLFTKWPEVYAIPDAKARTVAEALLEPIRRWGPPE